MTKGSTNYTWTRGRLLASVGGITFEYDAKGRRTKKGSTEYYYDGDRLIAELRPDDTLYYFYDESGVCGMCHNEVNYEFVRNIFGDVVAIYREDGAFVASYAYDAWGNCSVVVNENNVANINPFRYRGYYFDTESGLYYLMSRYYDPSIGQFISMDTQEYLKPDTIGGVDLYAYCGNNPVMRQDPTGHDWWNPAKWNWGLIADIAVTVVAIVAGVAAGIATATYTGSVKLGIAAGVATAGAVNNAANAIYYNYISDEQSAINEPSGESGEEESSHYVNNGYITRWERLDYTKAQTQEACYNVNAWRFYSEYNFHMYMWFATGWAHKRNIPFISDWAGSASYAEVSTDKWEEIDGKWSWRNWCYIALGLLGL